MIRKFMPVMLTGVLLVTLGCTSGAPLVSSIAPPPEAADLSTRTPAANTSPSGMLLAPEDFEYLGAFRLPGDSTPPKTFAYGGNAMTFNPEGDPNGNDDTPGSLFVMGHDRLAYGELPDGNQVAEINIPRPVISKNLADLETAEFIQDFQNVLAGEFTDLEEIPRVGMAYLNRPETGPKIHFAWGQHLQSELEPSHGWFDPDLDAASVQGFWYIGNRDPYSVNGYMFEIPAEWADIHSGGRYLATGRMRDGGMGGMGPSIFAYRPWLDDGEPSPDGAHLQEVPLLLYESSYNSAEITHSLNGYQHADEWEGGTWITTASGESAVLFAGTKGTGDKYWYGYIHPSGADLVCVDNRADDYADMCRLADGSLCTAADLSGCCDAERGTCVSNRGWWSNRFDAQFILYNPDDLAGVAAGQMQPWEPQPYAVMDIDEHLFLDPPEWDLVNLGWGDQRRYRVGDVAFDRQNGLLYVLELYADEAKPVVHVWKILPH